MVTGAPGVGSLEADAEAADRDGSCAKNGPERWQRVEAASRGTDHADHALATLKTQEEAIQCGRSHGPHAACVRHLNK